MREERAFWSWLGLLLARGGWDMVIRSGKRKVKQEGKTTVFDPSPSAVSH